MEQILNRVNRMIDGVLCSDSNEQTSAILSDFISDWHSMTHFNKPKGPNMTRLNTGYSMKIMEAVMDRIKDDIVNEITNEFDEGKLVDELVSRQDVLRIAKEMMGNVYEEMAERIEDNGECVTWDDVREEVLEALMEN